MARSVQRGRRLWSASAWFSPFSSDTWLLLSQWLGSWSIPARAAHVVPRGMRAIVIWRPARYHTWLFWDKFPCSAYAWYAFARKRVRLCQAGQPAPLGWFVLKRPLGELPPHGTTSCVPRAYSQLLDKRAWLTILVPPAYRGGVGLFLSQAALLSTLPESPHSPCMTRD
jgi:hypothetical protein